MTAQKHSMSSRVLSPLPSPALPSPAQLSPAQPGPARPSPNMTASAPGPIMFGRKRQWDLSRETLNKRPHPWGPEQNILLDGDQRIFLPPMYAHACPPLDPGR
ncbi:hypothetical protein K504DRAFT_10901 [Pleomassaria siparia CBS 279.74]|uniref:Uncharacterized protein n=1 Tax=Pleomassaria siparia CBS 279.74 TaxID=1314801 RepID=A0A6G1KPR2_9PLEO|nr:hypothetical protein K504DRAFT_10901 [Pleomassaria siparia CBS 279.74]